MTGNGVGDRVHNFFDQGSLSQDQSHAQLAEGNWQLFNQNLWSGSERQTAGTLNSSSKNYSAQQADIERAQSNQFSLGAHGLNFIPSSSKNEFVKNSSQLNSNGYMHSPQIFPPRQNEANFLGVNSEPVRHNQTSRGPSILESQQRSTLQHANSASFGGSEFPMNFNFLSSQQQMGGQPPGRLQSLPQPQSVINDTQLMQQHIMLKQMQEVQRQQQLQQLEAMQRNAASPMPTFPSQMDGHRSASNGSPMHNASSYQWHSPAGNVNWMQTGPVPDLQGYSNGPVIPEQGQTMHFMNLIPQQASHSLFGVPVSNSRTANLFPHNVDKPLGTQVAPPGSSFSGNPCNSFPEQMSIQDGSNVSGSVSEGKGFLEHGVSQGLGNVVNAGRFNQAQPRNVPMSEGRRQNSAGGSELVPEKSVTLSAGLDPTEEKILFGNDDNIWDAFGGSSLTGTGVNRLDGTDALDGFSFMQSGTWSALMQSAVAETSSSDAEPEELSGLDSQNSKLQSGNQPPSVLHDNKQMGSQVVVNNAHTANCFNTSGFPQSFPHQAESQISQGRKWLDCNKPNSHAESNHAPENAIPSQDCSKTDMGSWSHQRSTFLPQSSGQPSSRLNLNFIESVPENGAVVSSNQVNFHDNFSSRNMSTDTDYLASKRPNFNVKVGSPRVNTMDVAAASSWSNMKVNNEHNLKHRDRNDLDLWNSSNSYVKSEGSDKVLHNLNEGPAVLESSVSIPNHGSAKLHETGTGNQTENLNESHRKFFPFHAPPGGVRGNVWTDASESLSLPGDQEKLPCQSVKKPTAAQNLPYHPMGDVGMDVESSVAQKHAQSQPMAQHFSSVVKSHETQTRFFGSLSSNSMDIQQARVSGFQGAVKMPYGVQSAGVHSSCSPNTSATFVRSGEIAATNQHVPSSQNMLQFLNMVDQSNEQNVVAPHNLSDSNRLSNTTLHERDGFNQSQSSASHGFNLQLAPPSQGVASPNFHAGFQSSSRPMDSPKLGQLTSDKEEKNHAWLGSVSSAQCFLPSPLPSLMQSGSDKPIISGSMDADGSQQNLKGKLPAPVASVSPFFRNSLHNQHMTATSGKMVNDKSAGLFDRGIPHDHQSSDSKDPATAIQSGNNAQHNLSSGSYVNQSGLRASMNQVPGPPAAIMPDMSRMDNLSQLGANMWISQSHLLGAQGHNVSQTSSSSQVKTDEQDGRRKFDASTSQGAFGRNEAMVSEAQLTGETADASQEEKPTMENSLGASPSNSCASQKDVEAFRQSFKSNYVADNSYSLPNQMQAVKSTGTDYIHRESKRLKGSDGGPDSRQVASESSQAASGGLNNTVRDSSVSQPLVSTGNSNILSFAPQSGNRNTTFQFPHGATSSQDTLFGRNDPQKFIPGNVSRIEYSGIGQPQMAPSWVEQYGTLKNGQMLVPRIPANKNAEQQSVSGTSNELGAHSSVLPVNPVDTTEIANSCPPISAYTPREHVSSLEASAPHVPAPSLASVRQKKRKTATFDLVPWDKEVGQGIKRLPSMSLAEMNWARSSNRLVEKVEDETDNNDDASLITRPQRRLMLTTQLMQQVFRPPSAGILLLDASSHYEVILYFLARLALGDACNQICCVEDDVPMRIESGNPLTEKVKTSERIRDQYFSKVVEDFINRAKELEDDLVRLDKRAAILDIRLDSQDLERFSVINRFARFHGRSQVDGAEISSSSDATVVAQKPCLQRYVSAIPMPKSVPERVQCLSL